MHVGADDTEVNEAGSICLHVLEGHGFLEIRHKKGRLPCLPAFLPLRQRPFSRIIREKNQWFWFSRKNVKKFLSAKTPEFAGVFVAVLTRLLSVNLRVSCLGVVLSFFAHEVEENHKDTETLRFTESEARKRAPVAPQESMAARFLTFSNQWRFPLTAHLLTCS
jgi:hypothetical protein